MTALHRSLLMVAVLLTGCGQSDAPPARAPAANSSSEESSAKESNPKESPPPTVFDDLVATKERAKRETEQAVKEAHERTDAAIEQAEGTREK